MDRHISGNFHHVTHHQNRKGSIFNRRSFDCTYIRSWRRLTYMYICPLALWFPRCWIVISLSYNQFCGDSIVFLDCAGSSIYLQPYVWFLRWLSRKSHTQMRAKSYQTYSFKIQRFIAVVVYDDDDASGDKKFTN